MGEFFLVTYKHHLTVASVFRLREQVGRDKGGIGTAVGKHHHLGRSRRHIDGNLVGRENLLCRSYILVPRSENLVNGGNAFSAVCHCRNGLSSSDCKYPVDAAELGGPYNLVRDAPFGRTILGLPF